VAGREERGEKLKKTQINDGRWFRNPAKFPHAWHM